LEHRSQGESFAGRFVARSFEEAIIFLENIVRRGDRFFWRTSFAEAIVYLEHRIAKVTPQVKRTLFEETTDPS
jgi:hypothetical protein